MGTLQKIHVKDHWTIGGGGSIFDLIKVPPLLFIVISYIVWLIRHPKSALSMGIIGYAWYKGAITVLVVGVVFSILAYIVYLFVRESRHQNNSIGIRELTKGVFRVKKLKHKWEFASEAAGFKRTPKIKKIQSSPNGVKALVKLGKVGYTSSDLKNGSDEIAAVMGANECNVEEIAPGIGKLHIIWGDPTQRLLTLHDIPQNNTMDTVNFGLDADGYPVSLSLITSSLIVGLSRSGKSNTLWAIIAGMLKKNIPFKLRVIDPGGGVELHRLKTGSSPLVINYTDTPKGVDAVIEYARHSMYNRLRVMNERNDRTHTVTEEEPYEILLIDELLLLKNNDSDSALAEILSIGGKARHFVVALSQLSQVDALGRVRDLFPQRICLATKSQEMTDAVLGPGAERDGARCSRITKGSQGVGYYYSDEQRQYIRQRTPFITDLDADEIAQGRIPPELLTKRRINSIKLSNGGNLRNRKTAMYRLYNKEDTLLYTGITVNPNTRLAEHAEEKVWWSEVDQSKTIIVWFSNRRKALDAEADSIRNEHPIYNVVHAATVS